MNMKIGIFDSGLGGLLMAKAIYKAMPEYDYVYLRDSKRVPYGNRSHETVYQFTCEALKYLFEKENYALVILACNTASAKALKRIQTEFKVKEAPPVVRGDTSKGGNKVITLENGTTLNAPMSK